MPELINVNFGVSASFSRKKQQCTLSYTPHWSWYLGVKPTEHVTAPSLSRNLLGGSWYWKTAGLRQVLLQKVQLKAWVWEPAPPPLKLHRSEHRAPGRAMVQAGFVFPRSLWWVQLSGKYPALHLQDSANWLGCLLRDWSKCSRSEKKFMSERRVGRVRELREHSATC